MKQLLKVNWGWLAFGILLIFMFYALSSTGTGIEVRYLAPWDRSVPSELYYTLGMSFFVFPGAIFIAWGLADVTRPKLRAVWDRINSLTGQELAAGLLFVFALGLIGAMIGHALVMLGFPFTDDEFAAKYGGQLLASGVIAEPIPSYFNAIPSLFFYMQDGMMTSFEYLGALLPWAFADLTGTENFIFAAFVGLGAVGMVGAVGLRLSPAWGVVAGTLYLLSPMALSMSVSTHTHIISRGAIAASLFTLTLAQRKNSTLMWALTGLLAGGAIVTRPLHSILLLGPLLLVVLYEAWRTDNRPWKGLGIFFGFILVWGVLMMLHSYAVTDTHLPARFMPNALKSDPPFSFLTDFGIFKRRFGANLTYNFFMFAMWCLGPLTIPLAALGVRTNLFTKALAAGIGMHFFLAMLHDVLGIHMVGPIHYSETVVPAIILAVFGLFQVKEWMVVHNIDVERYMGALLVGGTIACAAMAHGNLKGLNKQAQTHDSIYSLFDDPKFNNSVVFAPLYSQVWHSQPKFRHTGGFVFQWRRIAPNNADRVVILHQTDQATFEKVKLAYPDRKYWVMKINKDRSYAFQEVN